MNLDFQETRRIISPYIVKTPLVFSQSASEILGKKIWFKLETQQPTGSFKVRPAFGGILKNLKEAQEKGVLTTSSGNFAQAVAYAAKVLSVKATIVMTRDTAPYKIERTQKLGAEVIFCGETFESRFETLEMLKKERDSLVIHGFDSDETISANGAIALELMEDLEGDFSVLSPASGGGLISGIAVALKEQRSKCEVFGVQPKNGAALYESLKKGQRVNVGKINTIADALVASMPGEKTFLLIQKWVNKFNVVSEDEIKKAVTFLLTEQKILAEPGGAVSVAGLFSGLFSPSHDRVVCIVSGGNVPLSFLATL